MGGSQAGTVLSMGNVAGRDDEAVEEQRAAQQVPHDPHLEPICRRYGQQEFSVYKFVPPQVRCPLLILPNYLH